MTQVYVLVGADLQKLLIIFIFLHCSTFGAVWNHIFDWFGWSTAIPYEVVDHFTQFTFSGGDSKMRQSILHLIWFATVWETWKERNNRI
ncbi:hypothetical protein MtrunA17_Chr3g0112591 [Medicago truncatula]|uniref:Transmembrane protein, putative n=1 Tax=Medicago truncatula TaxID=3880 RepID=G7JA18_MEDTR|nr:transmembrane protein, putative [Medicago truncatula]RHN68317.1 hypothetical protein MtrunA17_Chr3g0112591 [Medicago truncatula]